jgi:hypothetical protein
MVLKTDSRVAVTSASAMVCAILVVSRLNLQDTAGLLDGVLILGLAVALGYVGTYWSIPVNAGGGEVSIGGRGAA